MIQEFTEEELTILEGVLGDRVNQLRKMSKGLRPPYKRSEYSHLLSKVQVIKNFQKYEEA